MTHTYRAHPERGGLWSVLVALDPHQLWLAANGRQGHRAGDLHLVSAAPVAGTDGARWRLLVRPSDEATARQARAAGRLDVTIAVGTGAGSDDGTGAVGMSASVPADVDDPFPAGITLDYRARDFEAVRTSMLSAIAVATGGDGNGNGNVDGNVVGQPAALVELLAFVTDSLSYAQDAVATEANLVTARRRISVTRHATMLDYHVAEGANARTWVRVVVDCRAPFTLPARTPLLGHHPGAVGRVSMSDYLARRDAAVDSHTGSDSGWGVADSAVVFETMTEVTLHPYVQPHPVVSPDGDPVGLPDGAVTALVAGRDRRLRAGQLVSFEPTDGRRAGHVVRLLDAEVQGPTTLLTWSVADARHALPGPLAAYVGNLVLADHGATTPAVGSGRPWPALDPTDCRGLSVPLPGRDLTFAATLPADLAELPAAACLGVDRTRARLSRPAVELRRETPRGTCQVPVVSSLLVESDDALLAVVEMDDDRRGRVRLGTAADPGVPDEVARSIRLRRRTGSGPPGNVADHTLRHAVTDDARISRVVQPLDAVGGLWPESLSAVRLHAPQRFRRNDRLVTAADVEAAVRAVAGVLDASVHLVPDGPAADALVRVHTGWPQRDEVVRAVRDLLDDATLFGTRVAVRTATPIDVHVDVHAVADRRRPPDELRAALRARLRGQLEPGRFGFGTMLHRSAIAQTALGVPGVRTVDIALSATNAGRHRQPTDSVRPGADQLIRVDGPGAAYESLHVHLRWER